MKRLSNGRWQIRWRDKAGYQRARNFKTKDRAERELRRVLAGLVETDTRPDLSFKDFAERWTSDYCKVEKALTQQVEDPRTIGKYLLPAFGDRPISALSKMDLLKLRGELKAEGRLAVKSINLITGLARTMLEKAVEWELIDMNPFRAVKLLKQDEQPFQFWSVDERERFLAFARREDPAFAEVVEFTCHTGLRAGEVVGLRRDCLDFDRQVIQVRRSWNKTVGQLVETTKSRKAREIPMNPVVRRIVATRRLMGPGAKVFDLNPAHVSRQVKRIAKAAEVKQLRFHDLRHTFASHLAMAGVSLQKIQALLGHSDFRQTLRYAHLHPSSLQGTTDTLCALNVHSSGSGSGSTGNKGQNEWGHTDSNSDRDTDVLVRKPLR